MCLHPVSGTDRCPVHRRYLKNKKGHVRRDNLRGEIKKRGEMIIQKNEGCFLRVSIVCVWKTHLLCNFHLALSLQKTTLNETWMMNILGSLKWLFSELTVWLRQSGEIQKKIKKCQLSDKCNPSYSPVLPIPALQWTTIGGPNGWPAHWGPRAFTIFLCCLFTAPKKSMRVTAEVGTP